MDTLYVIINIIVLLSLLGLVYWMQRKHYSFTKRVFTALGLGVLWGVIINVLYGPDTPVTETTISWYNIVGTGYVRLLQMVVMPLIFVSIVAAFTRMKLKANIGKIGALVLAFLLGTTAIAAGLGISSALLFDLDQVELQAGEAEMARNEELAERAATVQDMTIPEQVISFLPENPFADLTGARATSTIGVVIFAGFIGIAYLGVRRKQPEHGETFAKLIDAIYYIVMRVVTLVLRLTPYGILALMTRMMATSNFRALVDLGVFVVASYTAIIAMFIVHLLLIMLFGLNPLQYVKKVIPVLTFAFTSRSSAGTLPLNVKTQTDNLGVSEGIANIAGSFGLSIGQNGCAGIYPAMLAIMAAPAAGIDPTSPRFIITLIIVITISSFGVAGVGGGATFASLIVLSIMGLPITIVGLLISVEPLIDMGRTALNVNDSMLAGLLTSKITGDLDEEVFARPTQEIHA